jgi:hypothetical protein
MTTATLPSSPSTSERPRYFINGWVDAALLGGVSLLCYAVFRALLPPDRSNTVIVTATVLMWFVNWPHFAATSWRLYGSRARIAQFPVTSVASILVVVCGVACAAAFPSTVAPWWLKLFMIWSPYHFSGQTVGVTMLYARRCGMRIEGAQRWALSAFVFGTFLLPSVRAETYTTSYDYYGTQVPTFGLPEWTITVATVVLLGGAVVFLGVMAKRWLVDREATAPIVLVAPLTQFIWFVPGGGWPAFAEFVPLFHSLQYMLIAWAVQMQERDAPARRLVPQETLRWWVLIGIGGAVLFALLPLLLSVTTGRELFFATGVMIAGVQIHHFFVDGVIWKLKNPRVRSPLTTSLVELSGRRAVVPVTASPPGPAGGSAR